MQYSKKIAVFVLAGTLVSGNIYAGSAQLEQQKQQKKEEQTQYQQQMQNQKTKIQQTQGQVDAVQAQINTLDGKISQTSSKIETLQGKIETLNEEIAKTQQQLEEAKANLASNQQRFQERMRVMYMNGNVEYLEIILNSKSVEDLLRNNKIISSIAKSDAELIQYIKTQIDTIKNAEQKLQQDRGELQESQNQLFAERQEYESAASAKAQYMASLASDIVAYQKEYDKAQAQWASLGDEIVKLTKDINVAKQKEEEARRKAELARQQAQQNRYSKGTSVSSAPRAGKSLNWPVPGHNSISSPYGWRTHPILKVQKFHTGVDIPAPQGTPVVAADSGVVIMAQYMGGYGNVVMVSHGGGMVTVYAHNSSMCCRVGQTVSRGEVISYVGSTGMSTGPHLHFEVRINGATVDPQGYI